MGDRDRTMDEWADGHNEPPLYPGLEGPRDQDEPPQWSLESEVEQHKRDLGNGFDGDVFVQMLDERLSQDVGYATEPATLDALVSIYVHDRPNYTRAKAILRSHKVLKDVEKEVQQRATRTKLHVVGSDIGPALIRSMFPDAPVSEDAVVPVGWSLRCPKASDYALIRMVERRRGDEIRIEAVNVARQPVFITRLLSDIRTTLTHVELVWLARGQWRAAHIARAKVMSAREITAALSNNSHFPVTSNNAAEMVKYMEDYEGDNTSVIEEIPVSTQMGWLGDDCELGFLIGDTHVPSNGEHPEIQFRPETKGETDLAKRFQSKGTLQGWASAIEIAAKQHPAVEFSIYASLAVPLLRVLRAPNFSVDWSGKSSTGKTATLRIAASPWSRPDESGTKTILHTWRGTEVSVERLAACHNDLPVILDDTKHAKKIRGRSIVSDMIFQISSGSGKMRGNPEGLQDAKTFRTIMLSSGETRMIDFDKSGGTVPRVITLWGSPFTGDDSQIENDVDRIMTILDDNYGLAGPAIVKYLNENRDKWDMLRGAYKQYRRMFRDRYQERMSKVIRVNTGACGRVAGHLAVIAVAARLAKHVLGLSWDPMECFDKLWPSIFDAATNVDREVQALRESLQWAAANRHRFFYDESHMNSDDRPVNGWLGYWPLRQRSSTGPGLVDNPNWNCVAFEIEPLRQYLEKQDYNYQAILRQWDEAAISMRRDGRNYGRRLHGFKDKIRRIVIPREVVLDIGGIFDNVDDDGQEEIPF